MSQQSSQPTSQQSADASLDPDPLAQLDPFAFLMDARLQFIAAVEAHAGSDPDRVALALGAVVAHDRALLEIAREYASGGRSFEGVTAPADRELSGTLEDAYLVRNELFEAIGTSTAVLTLDTDIALPWAGIETWRGHLIGLAMHEGAQAHALREGEPPPTI